MKAAEALGQFSTNVLAMARRDWAVRVLDASGRYWCMGAWAQGDGPRHNFCEVADAGHGEKRYESAADLSPSAARDIAAQAVWPSLSDEQRAEIGERP